MKMSRCGGGYIYSIPMSEIEYVGYFPGNNKCETVNSAYSRLAKERGRAPDFLFNAELFDFNTRAAASDVVAGGVVHRLTEGYGIAFPGNKKAVFSYKNFVGAKDYVGAYPVLVRNGKSEISIPAGLGGVRGRTAIGVGNDKFHVGLVPDSAGVSMQTLRTAFRSTGVTDAINLDGGGSTQYYTPTGKYFSGRRVRGFIAVWIKGDFRKVKVRTSLNIRSGPGITNKRVGKLYNGDVVKILEEKLGWCRIASGWVSSLYLKK
ncbi:MAG: phosphodiester glycosidase family protein [Oscillospiraceae bacterium]|nr:phosphodiester glycosidase family protein [Oscillospiraceae bacterium]